MSNDVILTIETRKPFTFRLSIDSYTTIIDDYNNYNRDYSYNRGFLGKIMDKLFNNSIEIGKLTRSWSIVQHELDNHFLLYGKGQLLIDNREIYAKFVEYIDYITEMSIEIIVNLSSNSQAKFYFEQYRHIEDEVIYNNYIVLEPLECLIVKPGSYIKTTSGTNKLLVFHISPMYIKDGIFGEPIWDKVFIREELSI